MGYIARLRYSMLMSLDGYCEDTGMEPDQTPHGRIAFEFANATFH